MMVYNYIGQHCTSCRLHQKEVILGYPGNQEYLAVGL